MLLEEQERQRQESLVKYHKASTDKDKHCHADKAAKKTKPKANVAARYLNIKPVEKKHAFEGTKASPSKSPTAATPKLKKEATPTGKKDATPRKDKET